MAARPPFHSPWLPLAFNYLHGYPICVEPFSERQHMIRTASKSVGQRFMFQGLI
jgi:hypothetical protein